MHKRKMSSEFWNKWRHEDVHVKNVTMLGVFKAIVKAQVGQKAGSNPMEPMPLKERKREPGEVACSVKWLSLKV